MDHAEECRKRTAEELYKVRDERLEREKRGCSSNYLAEDEKVKKRPRAEGVSKMRDQ